MREKLASTLSGVGREIQRQKLDQSGESRDPRRRSGRFAGAAFRRKGRLDCSAGIGSEQSFHITDAKLHAGIGERIPDLVQARCKCKEGSGNFGQDR